MVLEFNDTLAVCYYNATYTIAECFALGFPGAVAAGAFPVASSAGNSSVTMDVDYTVVVPYEPTTTSAPVSSSTTEIPLAEAEFNQWIIIGIAGAVLLSVLVSIAVIVSSLNHLPGKAVLQRNF